MKISDSDFFELKTFAASCDQEVVLTPSTSRSFSGCPSLESNSDFVIVDLTHNSSPNWLDENLIKLKLLNVRIQPILIFIRIIH